PPRAQRRLGKKKFHVCDEHGRCILIAMNRFPAGAARKAASKGLSKILVLDADRIDPQGRKGKWYAYIGKRYKTPRHKLTPYQKLHNMQYTTKVFRHELEPQEEEYGHGGYGGYGGYGAYGY